MAMARAGLGHRLRAMKTLIDVDARLLSMIAALLVICVSFDVASGGLFLFPTQFVESSCPDQRYGNYRHWYGVGIIVARDVDC